jgi:hypothetical protein
MIAECRSQSVIYLKNLICRIGAQGPKYDCRKIVCKVKAAIKPASPHMAINYYTLLLWTCNVFLTTFYEI